MRPGFLVFRCYLAPGNFATRALSTLSSEPEMVEYSRAGFVFTQSLLSTYFKNDEVAAPCPDA